MINPKKKAVNNRVIYISVIIIFVLQSFVTTYFFVQLTQLQNTVSYNSEVIVANNRRVMNKLSNLSENLALINTNVTKLDNSVSSNQNDIILIENEITKLDESINFTQSSLSEAQASLENQIKAIKSKTSSDFSDIIGHVIEDVISIKTNVAQGSGFIITSDGYVVTNAHVLDGATYAKAITVNQTEQYMSLIGYSNSLDLALLKLSGNYKPLILSDSEEIKVGEKVIAIGNPYGLSFSVTEGIISASHRLISGYSGQYVQIDAALNPGNSGGPLINTNGEVVGINNFKVMGDNLGFALESNFIKKGINEIAQEKLGKTLI